MTQAGGPSATNNPSVVVTGASKGIGEACAARLVRAGFHVFATYRSDDDAVRLRAELGDGVTPIRLDVTNAEQIRALAERVELEVGARGLAGLVNNAGIVVAGPLEFLPVSELRKQLEVNVIGQIAVTQALLPMLRRATGRVVMISSISGRSAMPVVGAYGISKFGLEAAADVLRVELQPWGIRVVLVEPGAIATPIWQTSIESGERALEGIEGLEEQYGGMLAGIRRRAERGMNGLPPDRVARVVENALTTRRPRARYIVGRDARLRLLLERFMPTRLRDALIANALKRL